MQDKAVFSLDDMAEYINLPKVTVIKLLQDGRVKVVKTGKHWRIARQAVDDFLMAGIQDREPAKRQGRWLKATADSQPEAKA